MMDPISPVIVTKVVEGVCSIIGHVISVGQNRSSSKKTFLKLASETLAEINELRKELGDSLGPVDRDQYSRYTTDAEKEVARLKLKVLGKSAAERLYFKATKQHKALTNKSNDIKRASLAAAKAPSVPLSGASQSGSRVDQATHSTHEYTSQPVNGPVPSNVSLNISNGIVNFGVMIGPLNFAPGEGKEAAASKEDLALQHARLEQLAMETREIREQVKDLVRAQTQHDATSTSPSPDKAHAVRLIEVPDELSGRINKNVVDAMTLVVDVAKDLSDDCSSESLEVISEDDSESSDFVLDDSDDGKADVL